MIILGGVIMSKHQCCGSCGNCNCSTNSSDPTSQSYEKNQRNKTSNNPPYGTKEPSTHTKHK